MQGHMAHNGLTISTKGTATRCVWLVSDDERFRRDFESRWRFEREAALFADMTAEEMLARRTIQVDTAVVKIADSDAGAACLYALDQAGAFVVCVGEFGAAEPTSKTVYVSAGAQALDSALRVTVEHLRRLSAEQRFLRAEESLDTQQQQAMIGRSVLDIRHAVNNTLTSIIGNAELLQLDERIVDADIREQIDTMQDMALRLHEMTQRIWSLESELQIGERSSHNETLRGSRPLPARAKPVVRAD